MGLIGAAFGIGFIIGPAIGGFMSRWGYALPGFVAAGLSLLAALVAIAFLPESLPVEKRVKPDGSSPTSGVRAAGEQLRVLAHTLGDDRFRGPIGATLLANTGIAAYTTIFPLLLDNPIGMMSAAEAGAFFAFAGVVSAVTQGGMVGPVVRRLGERRTAISVLAWAPGTNGILASLALLGVGWGLFNPSLLGILSSRADDADQGSVLGVNQSASALARVVGPAAGGWAFGALGYTIAFHAAAALLAAAALWLLVLEERPSRSAVET
jgi:MFS family permease